MKNTIKKLPAKNIKTREEWLVKSVAALRPLFKKHGAPIPAKVMVGCGWPRGGKTEVIGQCFGKTWTTDGTTHIFVSPTQEDSVAVLAILVHELVHAAVGVEAGHRGRFKEVALALGLEGKMTATIVSPKSPLHSQLKAIASKLGKYPHSKMTPKPKGGRKKPKRYMRLYSTTIDGYMVKVKAKYVEEHGLPKDPNGVTMLSIEGIRLAGAA